MAQTFRDVLLKENSLVKTRQKPIFHADTWRDVATPGEAIQFAGHARPYSLWRTICSVWCTGFLLPPCRLLAPITWLAPENKDGGPS